MPTCPKCGSTRVDRFCGKCGAATAPTFYRAVAAPPPVRPQPKRKSGLPVLFVLVVGLTGVFGFFSMTAVHVATIRSPIAVNDRTLESSSTEAVNLLRLLDADTDSALRRNAAFIRDLESRAVSCHERQADLANHYKEMINLRFRLQHALTQADDDDRYPVRVAGSWFTRPALLDAIDRVNRYVRDQESLDASMSGALGTLDRSTTASKERTTDLRNIRVEVSRCTRLVNTGSDVPLNAIYSLRTNLTRAVAAERSAGNYVPDPRSFTLAAFDLNVSRN